MHTDEMRRGIRGSELALQLRETMRPICPQYRPYKAENRHPVHGHCAPLHRPGWFVSPSIDEYGQYCTDPGFARCPWFRGAGEASPWDPDRGAGVNPGGGLR